MQGGWSLGIDAQPRGVTINAFDGAHPYHLRSDRGAFEPQPDWYWNFLHRVERDRGLDAREDLFRPGFFRAELEAGEVLHLTATAESGERLDGNTALLRETQRAQRLAACGAIRLTDVGAKAASGGGSIRRGARRCDWQSRRQDGDRRLSVVRRLGPRHHDRAARSHALDRTARGSCVHPAHVRTTRERRHVAEPLSRRRRGARIQHRRCDAVVLPRARLLFRGDTGCRVAGRTAAGDGGHPFLACARHALWHRGGSRRWICCAPAYPASSSPGWTPRSATGSSRPRIGKPVEINALWHFAHVAMARWSELLEDGAVAADFNSSCRPHSRFLPSALLELA